jgi:hypothetical protein
MIGILRKYRIIKDQYDRGLSKIFRRNVTDIKSTLAMLGKRKTTIFNMEIM